jgi:hypothetical protein
VAQLVAGQKAVVELVWVDPGLGCAPSGLRVGELGSPEEVAGLMYPPGESLRRSSAVLRELEHKH